MKKRLEKGTYGYIDKLKVQEWKKSAVMLAVPILVFLIGCTCHSGKPISFYREEAL